MAAVALLAGWTWPTPSGPRRPLVFPPSLPRRTLVVPILMYHRVGPEPSGPALTDRLTIPTEIFRAQMEWLRRKGFHAVSLRRLFLALEYGDRLPPRPVAITFDDGYRDVLWNATPVLVSLHMPATAFVITGRVGGSDPSFLTWPELRLLEARGVAIGSHTVHHFALPRLTASEAAYELIVSRRTLERHLGRPVQWLAYPAGAFDAQVLSLVSRAGYLLAVTTIRGDLQDARAPFLLHRDEVLDSTGVRGLAAMLGG